MKTIKELGISPTPWREASYGLIVSSDNKKVADFGNSTYDPKAEDFVMMMSAPKLYEKAYSVLDNLLVHLQWPEETIRMNRAEVAAMAKELRDALAEASGEVSNG